MNEEELKQYLDKVYAVGFKNGQIEMRVLTNDNPEQIARFWLSKREAEWKEFRDKIEKILLANTDIPEYTDAKAMEDLGKLYKELDEKLK